MTGDRDTDAAVLLTAAHVVIERRHSATRGVWPKAAALLGRQALETAVAERFPELADAPGRARNLCLPTVLGDDDLARDLIQSWGALSRATHHHAYDLPPTAGELERWLQPVWRLVDVSATPIDRPLSDAIPQRTSAARGEVTSRSQVRRASEQRSPVRAGDRSTSLPTAPTRPA